MGITIQHQNPETLVKEKVKEYVQNNQPFTSLQISNAIKKDGVHIRHRDISKIVRDAYDYYVLPNYAYERSIIDVETTEWDESVKQEKPIKTEAYLYHPFKYNPDQYTLKTLVALPIKDDKDEDESKSDDKDANIASSPVMPPAQPVDDKDDKKMLNHSFTQLINMEAQEYMLDGVFSYKAKARSKGLLLISAPRLAVKSLQDKNFDLKVSHKKIKYDVIEEKSVVNYTSIGEISVWKVLIEMADLQDDEIWVHMEDDRIVLDNIHPMYKKFKRSYLDKIVSFVVETPTSKTAAVQSVVLKINDIKKTKEGNFICSGFNFKHHDGEVELENTGRNYRFDRIYEDSIKILL